MIIAVGEAQNNIGCEVRGRPPWNLRGYCRGPVVKSSNHRLLTSGVRFPYTLRALIEDGAWDADETEALEAVA